ncbi:MAG TPA: hypothetical protein VFA62_02255 [Acidimicrobiia bacterium]|nr:hypothetical protein [Acidimicrobiia bacterium]
MNMRSIGTRTIAAVGAIGAVVGLTAAVAGAQTTPGRGPFASGMLTSVSGSALELQRTNPQDQSDNTNVSVTLTGSTTYQKVQETSPDAVVKGACVRVAGTGSVDKGKITASTVAITAMSSGDCARPGGANGAPPGSGPGTTVTLPNGGSTPNRPNRPGNGRRTGGFAFGSVQSVNGQNVVVKATTFSRRRQSGSTQTPPKVTTKKVKVTLSGSTKVTQLVPAAQSDLATGLCVSAAGTGDSEAITAQRVTISQPENGACTGGFGFAGGPAGGPGGGPTT